MATAMRAPSWPVCHSAHSYPFPVPHTVCMQVIRKVIFVFALFTIALATSACPEKGPMEKAGEKVDDAVDKAKDATK
jgi:hypothetical protein